MKVSERILLVEDAEDDVFLFKRALKAAHVTNAVDVVTGGQAAIDYLASILHADDKAQHLPPFIIFLDLKMPQVDGFEVLSWVRSQPQLDSVVVVVLSGSNESQDLRRAYALGARSYLLKPAKPEEIGEFIESMSSRWGKTEAGDGRLSRR